MKKSIKVCTICASIFGLGLGIVNSMSYAESGNVMLTVSVNDTYQLNISSNTSSANVGVDAINTDSMSTTLTVSTNTAAGWVVTVSDTDSDTSLKSGSNSIPTGAGIAKGTSAWGWKLSGDSTWKTMPASNAPINVMTGTTSKSTTVNYGVSTSASQASGNYTDTIVYSISANA